LSRHFARKLSDPEYCEECDKERLEAFIATDVNNNDQLDLSEWKHFCKKMCENLSKRVGQVVTPVSEAQMEVNFNLNRFAGKDGMTVKDFRLKE
jgi:hypothetical protein